MCFVKRFRVFQYWERSWNTTVCLFSSSFTISLVISELLILITIIRTPPNIFVRFLCDMFVVDDGGYDESEEEDG